MKVKQVRRWLSDKSGGKGRRRSLASEDNLAHVVQGHKGSEDNMDGAFPTPHPKTEHTFLTSKTIEKTTLDIEKNASTDPTVATRDDSPSTTPSLNTSELWNAIHEIVDDSWENNKFPDPDPTIDFSPSSSSKESIVTSENLGDFGSCEPRGSETISISSDGLKPRTMYNASIFGNKMMTARTLDLICNDGRLIQRAYSTPDYDKKNDEATNSPQSHDSPSITPGVLDSKMTRHLLDPYHVHEAVHHHQGSFKRDHQSIPRRKKIDPTDLVFLNPKERSSSSSSKILTTEKKPSSVSRGIEKFGGKKKSLVALRKEQLEKTWANNKKVFHVKKIEWGVCQTTGQYKKKIVVDVESK